MRCGRHKHTGRVSFRVAEVSCPNMFFHHCLEWFRSYLTGRKQFVSLNGTNSNFKNITCGVPQGSLLGPLLFILYINDFQNSSNLLSFILFADDTSVFFSHKNPNTLVDTVNTELSRIIIHEWICCNKLSLNVLKTHGMFFSNSISRLPSNVYFLIIHQLI